MINATPAPVGFELPLPPLALARFERIAPIAATDSASAWLIGYNHVARQALLFEPDFPECDGRGLELARQIALLTYRAEPGLHERQGRAQGGGEAAWSPARSYRMLVLRRALALPAFGAPR